MHFEYLGYAVDHGLVDFLQGQADDQWIPPTVYSGTGNYSPQSHLQFIGVHSKVALHVHGVSDEAHLRARVCFWSDNEDIGDLPELSYDQEWLCESSEDEESFDATHLCLEGLHAGIYIFSH